MNSCIYEIPRYYYCNVALATIDCLTAFGTQSTITFTKS